MTAQEKERLVPAILASIAVHVVALLIIQFADWRVEPLPEFSGPLYVSMEPVERVTPEDEARAADTEQPPEPSETEELQGAPAEEEPEAEPEPEPEPTQEPEAQPEPAGEPESSPQQQAPPERAPAERSEPEPPAAEQEAAPSSAAEPRDEPRRTYEYSLEDLHGDGSSQEEPGARQAPPESEEFQRLPAEGDSVDEQEELPDWATQPRQTVEDAGFSTEDVSDEEVEELAEKVATDPQFQQSLSDVVSALEGRSEGDETAEPSQPGADEGSNGRPGASENGVEGSAGDSDIEWVGTGNRELLNPPAVPEGFFSAQDFGGSVPAEASFVVVFDVDWRGNVVPGSVIFQQGAGFVEAQEKLRSRVRSWRFEPSEGAPNATGIFTLVVRRDDIQ